jgi:hypothetical protein
MPSEEISPESAKRDAGGVDTCEFHHLADKRPCVLPLGIAVRLPDAIGRDFPGVGKEGCEDETPADEQIVGLAIRLAEFEVGIFLLDEEGLMRQLPDPIEANESPDHRKFGIEVVLDLHRLREVLDEEGDHVLVGLEAGVGELDILPVVSVSHCFILL